MTAWVSPLPHASRKDISHFNRIEGKTRSGDYQKVNVFIQIPSYNSVVMFHLGDFAPSPLLSVSLLLRLDSPADTIQSSRLRGLHVQLFITTNELVQPANGPTAGDFFKQVKKKEARWWRVTKERGRWIRRGWKLKARLSPAPLALNTSLEGFSSYLLYTLRRNTPTYTQLKTIS